MVSKVCTELDNHYNMNDKDLAEFIIDLADKNPSFDSFKKVLAENGAEFADSFIENILRIIQHMMPKKSGDKSGGGGGGGGKLDYLKEQLPFLALPNDEKELPKAPPVVEEKNEEVDDMMSFLESMAPSKQPVEKTKDKRKSRSRSRDGKREKNCRSL